MCHFHKYIYSNATCRNHDAITCLKPCDAIIELNRLIDEHVDIPGPQRVSQIMQCMGTSQHDEEQIQGKCPECVALERDSEEVGKEVKEVEKWNEGKEVKEGIKDLFEGHNDVNEGENALGAL
jgi:hypothetical protein